MLLTERFHNVRLIIVALVFSLFAIEAVADPERVNESGTHFSPDDPLQWKEVGRGEMSWLWIDIYRVRLLTPDGRFDAAEYPKLLDIEYYRDITAEDLIAATVDQWRHLRISEENIARWQPALTHLWPDVTKGEHIAFEALSDDNGRFFFNGRLLENVDIPGFSSAFLAIWLSENTSRPALRAQLTGEEPCNC